MSLKKRVTFTEVLLIFLFTSLLLTSGSILADDPMEDEKYGGTVVVLLDRDTDTLDLMYTTWAHYPFRLLYEPLLNRDFQGNLIGSLAHSWEVSDDGLEITLWLRDDIIFHDGAPLDAEAIKRHYEILIDPEVASPTASEYLWMSAFEILEPHVIKFKMDQAAANALDTIARTGGYGTIQNPYAWEEHGPWGTGKYGSEVVVGTGSYFLDEWIPGDLMVLSRNPDYRWPGEHQENQGPGYPDYFEFRFIPEAATRMAELEAGNAHVLIGIPPEHVPRVDSIPDVELVMEPAHGLGYLAMATDKPPFDNVLVRRAINLAIDRQDIIDTALFGYGFVADAYVPPLHGENRYVNEEAHRYDPEEARRLLAEAGYPDGFTAELATENRTEHERVAVILQDMLADVGIDVNIRRFDVSGYIEYLRAGEQELFVREYSWPHLTILRWFLDSSQFPFPGHSRWQDERTDELIFKADYSLTLDGLNHNYYELQKHLVENAVWAPIWHPMFIQAVSVDLKGWRWHPRDQLMHMHDWYIDPAAR